MNTGYVSASLRSDRRKYPETRLYRYLSYQELKDKQNYYRSNHILLLDQNGKVARVKVTSIKTWKRKPDLEIHCQFGLYEFFVETVTPDSAPVFLTELD